MGTKVIGKNFPNYYSKKQVTGKLIFGADIEFPDTCYAKILRSKYAHAKIKNIDTLKARSLNGVLAIITGKDIPSISSVPLTKINQLLPKIK